MQKWFTSRVLKRARPSSVLAAATSVAIGMLTVPTGAASANQTPPGGGSGGPTKSCVVADGEWISGHAPKVIPLTEVASYMKATVCVHQTGISSTTSLSAQWDLLQGTQHMLGGSLIDLDIVDCGTGKTIYANRSSFSYPKTAAGTTARWVGNVRVTPGYNAPRVTGGGAVQHNSLTWFFDAFTNVQNQTPWNNVGDCVYIA